MRNINFKASMLALAATTALAGTAHATIAGGSSNTSNVVVGTSNQSYPPYHNSGLAGIAVQATGIGALVDFAGLESDAGGADGSGVYTISDPSGIDTQHDHLGVFHFAQVSGANVYFGEWAQTSDQTAASHTVYYVGDDGGTTTLPTAGTSATYSVKGINNYATNGILSGTFNADFNSGSTGTLTGTISGSSGSNGYTLDIGTANISGVSFSGATATATITGAGAGSATNGIVSGRFYGANAPALAGLVNFIGNARFNAAFGGAKN